VAFVFYDVETTGLDRRYDQIVGFAAIKTDEDLNEVDRFVCDCRLMPHVVASPGALERNGLTLEELGGGHRPTHFEAMRAIFRQLEAWGGALYVGYNSIDFDEEFLRHAFFLTLHPPYHTSMPGNGRADALALARTVALIRPGALAVGARDGRKSFRLEDICVANGVDHQHAHTALGDVLATVELCRRARDAEEEVWTRFLRNSTKAAVAEVVDVEPAFLHVRFKGNEIGFEVLVSLATDDLNPSARLCLPISFDAQAFKRASDEAAIAMVGQPGVPRVLKLNKSPIVCSLDEAPEEANVGSEATALATGAAWRGDDALRRRLCDIVRAARPERVAPTELEDMLYHDLPDGRDRGLLRDFQNADWEDRRALIASFHDPRHRAIGRRLLYLERPDLLDPQTHARMEAAVADRVRTRSMVVQGMTLAGGNAGWTGV
jgi:exodeoxyribonuclease-1